MTLSSPKYRDLYRNMKHDKELVDYFKNNQIYPRINSYGKVSNYFIGRNVSLYYSTCDGEWSDSVEVLMMTNYNGIDDSVKKILLRHFPKDIVNEIARYMTKKYYTSYKNFIPYVSRYYPDKNKNIKLRLKHILSDMYVYESFESFMDIYNHKKSNKEYEYAFWTWINKISSI